MENALAKQQEHALNIFDSETGKFVEISPEQQRMAAYVHQQIIAGSIISAMALKKIKDEKLYLGLACQSFEEYIHTMLPYGRRTAYYYLKIANKLELLSANKLLGNNLEANMSENTLENVQTFAHENVAGLDYNKLVELTKLEDDEFKALIKNGEVEINGQKLSLDDIKDMTAREAAKEIKRIKQKYQEKVDTQAEEIKKLLDEKEALREQIELNEEKLRAAEEMEKLYGSKASTYEHKLNLLNDAEELLNRIAKLMSNADIQPEDSLNLQEKFVHLIRKLDELHGNFIISYQNVTANF